MNSTVDLNFGVTQTQVQAVAVSLPAKDMKLDFLPQSCWEDQTPLGQGDCSSQSLSVFETLFPKSSNEGMRGEVSGSCGARQVLSRLPRNKQHSGMLFQVLQATHLNAYKLWSCECVCIYMCEVCVQPAQQGEEGICMNVVEIIALLRQKRCAESSRDQRDWGPAGSPSTSSPLAQPFLTLNLATSFGSL